MDRELNFNTSVSFEGVKGLFNYLKRKVPCEIRNCEFAGSLNFSGENPETNYGRLSGRFIYARDEDSRGYEIPFHFLVGNSKTGQVYHGMKLRVETRRGTDEDRMSEFEQILVGQIDMYLTIQRASRELGA